VENGDCEKDIVREEVGLAKKVNADGNEVIEDV